jgi:hypothetical protein
MKRSISYPEKYDLANKINLYIYPQPEKRHAMRDASHTLLQREVEKKYGKKVLTYSDCLHLTGEISKKTGFRINVSTIRRFFGLVKANYPPSPSTRDILAKFVGFNSFEHFTNFQHHNSEKAEQEYSILLHYLEILFSKASATTYSDPTWLAITRQTILFLDKHPLLIDAFQRAMSKSVVGQEVYYEQFVNIDQLNGYYGDGLRYYLTEKLTSEGQIFAHSLLALCSFLVGEQKSLEVHYRNVIQHSLDKSVHPFVCGRHFATQLLYHHDDAGELSKVALNARMFYKDMVPSKDAYHSFPCFELIMAEALLLTRQPLEALFYIKESKKKKTNYIPPAIDVQLFSVFDLYEAAAYFLLGDDERAKKIFKKVNPTEFYFLSRYYYNVIYLLLDSELFPSRKGANDVQINDLVQQLGFVQLLWVLAKPNLVNKKEQEIPVYI